MREASARNASTATRFFELLTQKDIDGWAGLWALDARIIVPYPPQGFAPSIEGRAAIVSGFRELYATFDNFRASISATYRVVASDAVVIEYDVNARLRSGVDYANQNIAVFRFDTAGLITAYHDYFDPRRFSIVADALPDPG